MSVSKWKYTPACDGDYCVGDCDLCSKEPEAKAKPTYIDKDKLMNEFIEFVAPSNRDSSLPIPTWNDAVSLLGSAPDADVEAVVHCNDCEYYETEGNYCNRDIVKSLLSTEPTDFCSWAERRESNE